MSAVVVGALDAVLPDAGEALEAFLDHLAECFRDKVRRATVAASFAHSPTSNRARRGAILPVTPTTIPLWRLRAFASPWGPLPWPVGRVRFWPAFACTTACCTARRRGAGVLVASATWQPSRPCGAWASRPTSWPTRTPLWQSPTASMVPRVCWRSCTPAGPAWGRTTAALATSPFPSRGSCSPPRCSRPQRLLRPWRRRWHRSTRCHSTNSAPSTTWLVARPPVTVFVRIIAWRQWAVTQTGPLARSPAHWHRWIRGRLDGVIPVLCRDGEGHLVAYLFAHHNAAVQPYGSPEFSGVGVVD